MKVYTTLLLCALVYVARGQTPAYQDQPYGKVDIADLQMTTCDFEKDANAEVLSRFGVISYSEDLKSITLDVHERIKIFNANGKDFANIKISYYGHKRLENITKIKAQTINLVDSMPEITRLDDKLIYDKEIDDISSEVSFAMPDVKSGSIIEYQYRWTARYNASIPFNWYFQTVIPVRYSQISTFIPDVFYYRVQPHLSLPLALHTSTVTPQVLKVLTHNAVTDLVTTQGDAQQSDSYPYYSRNEAWGMANIPSLHTDSYTSSYANNVQYIGFDLVNIKPINGYDSAISNTWANVGYNLYRSKIFGAQLNRTLTNEQDIISKAALLKTDDDKIATIFNAVKTTMKWNGSDTWYTRDGTVKAWDNKSGNSTEVNLVLCHLLTQAGIDAYPLAVSTRTHGRVDPNATSFYQFNRTVVYVPAGNAKNYILDATDKYNLYYETPAELLNSLGLRIDKAGKIYDTISVKNDDPVRQVVLINAVIKPNAKIDGTAQINLAGYDRIGAIKAYKTDGEKIYIDSLVKGNNNLKISSVKFENMEVDTLPLTQNIIFGLDLPGSDENYIYVNPNIFTPLKTNPFLADTRLTDIYYGFLRNYSINGVYKIPAGYKTDALPKSVSMVMPDKSIAFKRIVAEQDGSILVHFIVDIRKKAFGVDEYPGVHDFYKKMYDMLNEQIVLKKL